jgi:hypothetical protein
LAHPVQDWPVYGLHPLSGFFYRTRRFGDWLCLRPQVDEVKPIQLGPVEWANLDHSTGPNWIGFTWLHLPEDGDKASHRNVMFYRRNRTMDVVHKQVSLVHRVPSSEFFQAWLILFAALRSLGCHALWLQRWGQFIPWERWRTYIRLHGVLSQKM